MKYLLVGSFQWFQTRRTFSEPGMEISYRTGRRPRLREKANELLIRYTGRTHRSKAFCRWEAHKRSGKRPWMLS